MLPHLGVHGRREEHRASRGQQGGGQEIIGSAGDSAGQQIGGGRNNHDEVGLLTKANMRDVGDILEYPGVHGVSGQRLEGRGADETQRRLGGNHPDFVAGFTELTHHRTGLVGRDATGDADDDPLGAHGDARAGRGYSPSVCSRRSP